MSSGISITKGQALFVPAQSEDDDSEPLWWRPPSPPSDTLSTCASEPSTASSQDLGEDYIPYDDLVEFVSEKLDAMQRFPLDYREGRDRHPDITPFAFNQVRIDGRATQTNGSWICFPENDPCISVLHKPAKYIAISAPMPDYFSPFMRMLQQEAVPLIVSLSAFSEAASLTNPDQPLTVKTDPYLPYEEGEVLEVTNQYTITCLKVHPSIPLTPEWTLEQRDFRLNLAGSTEPHYFTQCHLPNWRDLTDGVVEGVANLVKYIYDYRNKHFILAPIVAHCSGGVGRVGTFLICSEIYEKDRLKQPARIFDIAAQGRFQRPNLGGNKRQYQLLYRVREALLH